MDSSLVQDTNLVCLNSRATWRTQIIKTSFQLQKRDKTSLLSNNQKTEEERNNLKHTKETEAKGFD